MGRVANVSDRIASCPADRIDVPRGSRSTAKAKATIMIRDDGTVRSISWRDVCPWTLVFRFFRLSVSLQLLTLALTGAALTPVGWRVAEQLFPPGDSAEDLAIRQFALVACAWPGESHSGIPLHAPPEDPEPTVASDTDDPADSVPSLSQSVGQATASLGSYAYGRLPCYLLVEPFRRVFDPYLSWRGLAFYLAGGLWTLLVWCFLGGTITRIAAVRLGRDERVGLRESMHFARRKLLSFVCAPMLPLVPLVGLAIPLMCLGLAMRLDMGIVLAGLSWSLVGLTAFVMVLFGFGLLAGWPLMWSTISTEGTDAFDAISRSYAYTYQRPLHYLLYAAVSLTLGACGWLLVSWFCEGVILFADWGLVWGTGAQRLVEIQDMVHGRQPAETTLLGFGVGLIEFFNGCVRSFPAAYAHSFFWVATAGVYLLLRRDADHTEFDDIYLHEDDDTSYGLPPFSPDEIGVPGVSDMEQPDSSEPGTDGQIE